jgi:hypothetical protein
VCVCVCVGGCIPNTPRVFIILGFTLVTLWITFPLYNKLFTINKYEIADVRVPDIKLSFMSLINLGT